MQVSHTNDQGQVTSTTVIYSSLPPQTKAAFEKWCEKEQVRINRLTPDEEKTRLEAGMSWLSTRLVRRKEMVQNQLDEIEHTEAALVDLFRRVESALPLPLPTKFLAGDNELAAECGRISNCYKTYKSGVKKDQLRLWGLTALTLTTGPGSKMRAVVPLARNLPVAQKKKRVRQEEQTEQQEDDIMTEGSSPKVPKVIDLEEDIIEDESSASPRRSEANNSRTLFSRRNNVSSSNESELGDDTNDDQQGPQAAEFDQTLYNDKPASPPQFSYKVKHYVYTSQEAFDNPIYGVSMRRNAINGQIDAFGYGSSKNNYGPACLHCYKKEAVYGYRAATKNKRKFCTNCAPQYRDKGGALLIDWSKPGQLCHHMANGAICGHRATRKRPGQDKADRCKEHAPHGAEDVVNTKCERCKMVQPRFNFTSQLKSRTGRWCADCSSKIQPNHPHDLIINVVDFDRNCACGVRPSFAEAAGQPAKWCEQCIPPGSSYVDVVSRLCQGLGQDKPCYLRSDGSGAPARASHGMNMGDRPTWCSVCAPEGAVNVVTKRCETCHLRLANFGMPGQKKQPRWCGGCKQHGAVDVNNARCSNASCRKRASFGIDNGTGRATTAMWCFDCKPKDAKNMYPVCNTCSGPNAYYSKPNDPFKFCRDCRPEGALNCWMKRCMTCRVTVPSFGYASDFVPRWCEACCKGMEGVRSVVGHFCQICDKSRACYGFKEDGLVRWCRGCVTDINTATAPIVQLVQRQCIICDDEPATYMDKSSTELLWCSQCKPSYAILGTDALCQTCPEKAEHISKDGTKRWCHRCAPTASYLIGTRYCTSCYELPACYAPTGSTTVTWCKNCAPPTGSSRIFGMVCTECNVNTIWRKTINKTHCLYCIPGGYALCNRVLETMVLSQVLPALKHDQDQLPALLNRASAGTFFRPDSYWDLPSIHLILEVDENQHQYYGHYEEALRMKTIAAKLRQGKPVVFVRLNPDTTPTHPENLEIRIRETVNLIQGLFASKDMDAHASSRVAESNLYILWLYYAPNIVQQRLDTLLELYGR